MMKFSALTFAVVYLAVVVSNAACAAQPSILGASSVRIDPPAPPGSVRPAMPIPQTIAAASTDNETPTTTKPRSLGMWSGSPVGFFAERLWRLPVTREAIIWPMPPWAAIHISSPCTDGPIPFFTIEPNHLLSNHEHYVTASAGFNGQNVINEWLLTTHPNLRAEDEPFFKGMATFNFWLTVGYAATAFAGAVPSNATPRAWPIRWAGMKDGWGDDTGSDGSRYLPLQAPDAKWACGVSRLSKIAMILLAVTVHY